MEIIQKISGIVKNNSKYISIGLILASLIAVYFWYRNRLARQMAEEMFFAFKTNNIFGENDFGYYKEEFVPTMEAKFRKENIISLRKMLALAEDDFYIQEVAKMKEQGKIR